MLLSGGDGGGSVERVLLLSLLLVVTTRESETDGVGGLDVALVTESISNNAAGLGVALATRESETDGVAGLDVSLTTPESKANGVAGLVLARAERGRLLVHPFGPIALVGRGVLALVIPLNTCTCDCCKRGKRDSIEAGQGMLLLRGSGAEVGRRGWR